MSGVKKVPLENIQMHHKMWMATPHDEGILGDGKWQILRAIEETGSLKAACEKLELTYRRTWGDLKKIEEMLGFPLLEKSRGGKEGGMSQLSPQGKKLVAAFDEFHRQVDPTIRNAFDDFRQKLVDLNH